MKSEKYLSIWKWDRRRGNVQERVHTLQTCLWVGLILIQMAAVSGLSVRAEAVGAVAGSEGTGGLAAGLEAEAGSAADSETPDESEASYREQLIEQTVEYRSIEAVARIPETITVMVEHGEGTAAVVCNAKEKRITGETWQEDFSFLATVHVYDADYYQLGEKLISGQTQEPDFGGCEGELLRLAGLEPENYEVTSYLWEGETYEDEGGETCRDVRVFGRRRVRDYQVRYTGLALLPVAPPAEPARPETLPESTEETAPETEAETVPEEPTVVVQTQPETAEPVSEEVMPPETLWEQLTRTLLLAIGVGALLFFGGLFLLGLVKVVKYAKK